MAEKHFILATAGHVDHGKSALVKALTGIDPDRLPEEKARGITIDLGFAHLEVPAPPTFNAQPSTFRLGIVDVPGHEDFVKNMVAGVGSIDLALFVVAADDGWMPQTEEHLQILTYLGVTRAVVALTKIDLAEADEEGAEAGVREKLQGSPFAGAPIVRTSVIRGRGCGELVSKIAQVLADAPPPQDLGKPRLPVDRVFTLRGIGTVVTGTLTGGAFRRGQAVVIQPEGKTTRLR
ncbi:MAG: GTP-binding protein, partial [Verrucomicrobiota bacterium]